MEALPQGDTDPAEFLSERLADLRFGEGTLLVTGDPGMGKTHLLHRAARSVRNESGQVGWCQCNRALGGEPLWEWRFAIEEIDDALPGGFPGTDDLEVFQTVWRWLETTAANRPTILVLDDLHDASRSTIDLFDHIGRRPRTAPWLVVAAARLGSGRVDQLNSSRLAVGGIDAREAVRLAEGVEVDLTHDRAEELVRFTGGNPLFIRRILETGGDSLELSSELLSAFSSSMVDLDPGTVPVAEALSVLGTSASMSTLRLMVGSDQWPTRLNGGRTIAVDGEDVVFRHPLVREVIYDQLPDDRRSQLHARAAHVVEQLGGPPSLAAVHWSRAALAGQGKSAAETSLRAGHLALEMSAWTDAVSHYSHAGAVLEQLHAPDDRAASGAYRARALSMDGMTEAAFRAIVESVPEDRPQQRVALRTRQLLARELHRLRWREEPNPSVLDGEALVRVADMLLDEESDPVSRSILATIEVVAGEIDGLGEPHVAVAREALDSVAGHADPVVRGEAHLTLRRALMTIPGTHVERLEASKAAVAASRESRDAELTGRSLRMLLTDAMGSGDRSLAMSAISAFETTATTALREHQALGQAGLASIEGRYRDASDILDGAAKELSYVGRNAPSLEFVRAIMALDQGGLSASLAQYEPLLTVVADASLRAAFAFAAVVDGEHDRAADLVDGAMELLGDDWGDPLRPISLSMAAEAASVIGHDDCARLLSLLEPLEGSCITPANSSVPWLGSADRLIGLLRARAGDLAGAEQAIRSSLATHRQMGAHPWVARSLIGLGAVLRGAGRADEAAMADDEARAIVDRLDMGRIPVPDLGTPRVTGAGSPTGRLVHLERADRGWLLRPDGTPGNLLPKLTGLGQLAMLVSQPGREWHVLDLAGSGSGVARPQAHAGEVLDDRARRSYQNRMAVLRADLDDAEKRADMERAAQLLLEIDAIESELLAAFGLGGRGRRMGDGVERARINVRRSLSRAFAAIEQVDARLGDHVRHRVVTGRFCSYRPAVSDPTQWSVRW